MTRAAPHCTFHNDGFAPASEQCLDDCGVVSKRRRHVQGRFLGAELEHLPAVHVQ